MSWGYLLASIAVFAFLIWRVATMRRRDDG